ncbi:MAG TPA: acyltransferase family protein [Telluria sp.]|nr:acyltransferase family protein [Telluria sp.]
MMPSDLKRPRLAGLDTLRALAIVLVLMSHYNGFVSRAPTFGAIGSIGWAGVDLFFVLSGYLIGNQLLAPAARGLTCAALSPCSLLNRLRIPGTSSLALWSYAVYLVHKPVFMALRPMSVDRGVDPAAPLTIIAVMAAGILGGWLLYRMVETPFMNLRERLYPADLPKTRCTAAPPVVNAIAR